jgi:hypothetical protein
MCEAQQTAGSLQGKKSLLFGRSAIFWDFEREARQPLVS